MTSILDLPEDVIRRILAHCAQYIVHQLLKSKTVAAIAYSVLFENVEIKPARAPLPLNHITSNYDETIEVNPFDYCGFELFPKTHEKPWQFSNPRELISFYKTHPLFEPHTLTYHKNDDLMKIKKLKPGFLNKFKYFVYTPVGQDTIVFDISDLKHKAYSCFFGDPSQYPKHIETLSTQMGCPNSVNPSVTTLITQWFPNQDCSNLPNLKHLKVTDDLLHELNAVTIESVEASAFQVDLSNLPNLKTAILRVGRQDSVVGYSSDCQVRLPKTLQNLQLGDMWDCSQISLGEGEALKQLVIKFCSQIKKDISQLKLPANLVRLAICGESLVCDKYRFSETIENLTLNGFNRCEVVVPPNVRTLNLLDCFCEAPFKLKDLKHLTTLKVTRPVDGLPPQLENLQYSDSECNTHCINGLMSLKDGHIRYNKKVKESELVIPSTTENLVLDNPTLSTISGGESLSHLEIGSDGGLESVSLLQLKSLKVLTIKNQVPPEFKKTSQQFGLPEIPSSLEVLVLDNIAIPDTFECPDNLKYLRVQGCTLSPKSKFKLNESLEVLWLDGVTLDATSFFKSVGKALEFVQIQRSTLGVLEADFTETNLQRLHIGSSQYTGKDVKFPRCLQIFRMFDRDEKKDVMKWADLSLCDRVCEVTYPQVVFDSLEDIKSFLAEISKKMEDFTL